MDVTNASIVMLAIKTEETIFEDCYSDIPCIPGQKRIVWTVKDLFIVETVLL